MSSFEETLWSHLVQQHGADQVDLPAPVPRRRRRKPMLGGLLSLAALAAGFITFQSAPGGPAPAFAITMHAHGEYTITLDEMTRGIPALNATLKRLHVRATVVPIERSCPTRGFDVVGETPGSMRESVTVSDRDIPAGERAFIAAKRASGGRILLAEGTTAQQLPSCFAPGATVGELRPSGRPAAPTSRPNSPGFGRPYRTK
jgi:hypothetical protein